VARPISVTYRISPTPDALSVSAAEFFTETVIAAVNSRGVARVAISGSGTPKALFTLLADRNAPYFAQLPWDRLQLFWVDERCVPPTDADSNYRMTYEAMLSRLPLPAAQIHRIEGELDPEVAAARYESTIRNVFRLEGAEIPTFDLVLLGMGEDGHTASLFAGSPNLHRALNPAAVAGCVGMWAPAPPQPRLSLNLTALLDSRRIVLLIAGDAKWRRYEAACAPGPADEMPVRGLLRAISAPLEVCWSP